MKISKLFHWLYAILMFLPIMVFIPTAFYYGFNDHAEAQEKTTYEKINITYNQLIENGNFNNNTFSPWRTNDLNANLNIENNILSFSTSYTIGDYYIEYVWGNNIQPIENHKYLYKFDINLPNTYQDGRSFFYLFSGTTTYIRLIKDSTYSTDTWLHFESIITGTGNVSTLGLFRFYYDLNGGIVKLSNCNLFDLSLMYGVGNEPTIEEFNLNFNLPYYSYSQSKQEIIDNLNSPIITNMSITDSMSYAWNSTWQNDLFSWSYDSFLTQPFLYITNLFNVPPTNTLLYCLSYWLNISIIWLVFDVVLYVPLLVHRWLDKGIVE